MNPEGGSLSLEVRWILPGQVSNAMIEWFGPFGDAVEDREDWYLVDPSCDDFGVKIRGATQLDLKAFRGSPGEVGIRGGGRGRIELWEKWSFHLDARAHLPPDASSWLAVQKVRRRRSFRLTEGGVVERAMSDVELPGCTVELTEVGGRRGDVVVARLRGSWRFGAARSGAARNRRIAVPKSAARRHPARSQRFDVISAMARRFEACCVGLRRLLAPALGIDDPVDPRGTTTS